MVFLPLWMNLTFSVTPLWKFLERCIYWHQHGFRWQQRPQTYACPLVVTQAMDISMAPGYSRTMDIYMVFSGNTCFCQEPCWCEWPMQLTEAMWILWCMVMQRAMLGFVLGVVAWGHVDVHGSCYLSPRASWSVVFQGWATIRDHIGICRLCCYRGQVDILVLYCHQGLWWCLWPVLQQRALLMYVVFTSTSDHAEVQGKCLCQRPCECLWFVLSPETMWKSMICVPIDCRG